MKPCKSCIYRAPDEANIVRCYSVKANKKQAEKDGLPFKYNKITKLRAIDGACGNDAEYFVSKE